MKKLNASALRAVLTFTAILALILITHAQGKTFTIRGQVLDDLDSMPIAGAVVHIPGTKFSDTANADGYFMMSKVPAGTSVFTVTADKYEKWSEKIVVKKNTDLTVRLLSLTHTDIPVEPAPTEETQEGVEPVTPPAGGEEAQKEEQEESKKEKKRRLKEEKKRKKEKEAAEQEEPKKEKPKKKTEEELKAEQFAKKDMYEKKIEDVVAFENLYFSDFIMGKGNRVKAIGFFSIENKQIYSFEANFKWIGEVCVLQDVLIELKGSK